MPVNRDYAIAVWESMYTHILQYQRKEDEPWIFLHYNQFRCGTALEKLKQALGVAPDSSFVDPSLARSHGHGSVPDHVESLYDRLCKLADYSSR